MRCAVSDEGSFAVRLRRRIAYGMIQSSPIRWPKHGEAFAISLQRDTVPDRTWKPPGALWSNCWSGRPGSLGNSWPERFAVTGGRHRGDVADPLVSRFAPRNEPAPATGARNPRGKDPHYPARRASGHAGTPPRGRPPRTYARSCKRCWNSATVKGQFSAARQPSAN